MGLSSAISPCLTPALVAGPMEFDAPVWLWVFPVLAVASVLIARKSLSGLDSVWRWVALAVRLIVIALLVMAVADPYLREESKKVAVTVIMDVSESIPTQAQHEVQGYIEAAAKKAERDRSEMGIITTAREAYVSRLASQYLGNLEYAHQGTLDATDLATALRLGIATAPKDAANRFVLITDGNQTTGDVLEAADAAKAIGIPVDVLPIQFKYDREVIVEKLLSPPNAREGETMNVRVVLQASGPANGRLNLLLNGQAVDLNEDPASMGMPVELRRGQNVFQVPVTALRSGPQKFEAVFEAETKGGVALGDSLAQNNRGESVTFVSGEGKVLVIGGHPSDSTDNPEEYNGLVKALEQAKITVDFVSPAQAPTTLTEMNAYEAIVLVNQPASEFSQKQQEQLRQYVYDTGGGLVMVGGPQSYGAGGWIGSPLEEALPLKLDPPQKRQMPRGALVLTIHSCEMPEGVFYGKKVCEAAVNRLSRLDLAGINEYTWGGGTEWVHSIQPVGDGTSIKRAINKLQFGDMPDFTPSFQLALKGFKEVDAGQKHMIVISDGDPQSPPDSLLQEYVQNRITVSCVGVFPHGGADTGRMKYIADTTKGKYYFINDQAGLAKLPEIFMKEAMTVRRSLIWEKSGDGLPPNLLSGASEALRGIRALPNVNGYVVTAERDGLALVTAKINKNQSNPQGDPLLAQWQYGLGRVVAYTSDAAPRWNPQWTGWEGYKQFWEQHVRWALRPQGTANLRVMTENRGDQTLVTVEALDSGGERLSFANFVGRLARPDGGGEDVRLTQVAPGRYQAVMPTDLSGSYMLSLRYAAPDPKVQGGTLEGSVQAAISRPFADEYRVLQDNSALLTRIAEMTGGRVLPRSPEGVNLWDDKGLTMPVARTSIWLAMAVMGMGLFLVDVAVRRVRIDIPAIASWVRSGFGRGKTVSNQQLGGLRAAREQAREKIAARATSLSPAELERQAKAAARQAQETSKAKFEATPDMLRDAGKGPVAMGGADAQVRKVEERQRPTDPGGKPPAPDEGMSRLLKAKKKAQEGMEDGPGQ
ncbi:MAG: VWA domain-containing protein [Phycisphaerales bacterium]